MGIAALMRRILSILVTVLNKYKSMKEGSRRVNKIEPSVTNLVNIDHGGAKLKLLRNMFHRECMFLLTNKLQSK